MKRRHSRDDARRMGSSLVVTLVLTVATSGMLIAGVTSGLQRAFVARKLTDRLRAQSIAEAGVCQGYSRLAENFDARTNGAQFLSADYGGGRYEVTAIAVGRDQAVIDSKGYYGNMMERVVLDTRMYQRTIEGPGETPYGYAILVDGDIAWTGCGTFEGQSRVHANGAFRETGSSDLNALVSSCVDVTLVGSSMIHGDATAPNISAPAGSITGTETVGPVAGVDIPQIDLAPYYDCALKNGQVFTGRKTITHGAAPVGGVMWVNGDLVISGADDLTGCFIATGNIRHGGSGNHHRYESYPAFVSRDGSIALTGSGSNEGLIYARVGNVDFTGGGKLTGALICGGNLKKSGNSIVVCYQKVVPRAPGVPVTEGVLCVSAWQR